MLAADRQVGAVRRALAVFADFIVYFGVFAAVGISVSATGTSSSLGPWVVPALLALHVVLTALYGTSPGRLIAGVRVIRPDGEAPGLALFAEAVGHGSTPRRMWWDVAAGTIVVRA